MRLHRLGRDLFGAQHDRPGDLLHLELLKTWPIAPAATIRGEILGPAALLTIVAQAMGKPVAQVSEAVPDDDDEDDAEVEAST